MVQLTMKGKTFTQGQNHSLYELVWKLSALGMRARKQKEKISFSNNNTKIIQLKFSLQTDLKKNVAAHIFLIAIIRVPEENYYKTR